MNEVAAFLGAHPPAAWAAIAGVFLVVELVTGSGWLLWPCGAAAVVALASFSPAVGWPIQLVLFAVLTVAFTIPGRRWLTNRRLAHHAADPNDPRRQLIGQVGEVTAPFENGRGRVFVGGKEWAADLDPAAEAPKGAPIRVLDLLSGSRLSVTRV